MRYQFDDVAAAAIIDAINKIPVTEASGDTVTYSNTDPTTEPMPGDVTFSVSWNSVAEDYFLATTDSIVVWLGRFGWSNRRRIVKAMRRTRDAFISEEKREKRRKLDIRAEGALNVFIKVLTDAR